MNSRTIFTRTTMGVAVLGMALCVPAAMLAQGTPPSDSQAMSGQQANPGEQPMMRHRRPPSPKRQLRRMTRMLNLTPDQQQKMLPILRERNKRMEAIRNNSALSPEQRRQQMRDTMMDTHRKLEAIMTDSQKRQFEQEMQQRRQRRMGRGGMGRGMMGQGMGGAGTPPPPPPQQ